MQIPGMYHCNRGPGPNFFEVLAALEQWVEHDTHARYVSANLATHAHPVPTMSVPRLARWSHARAVGTARVRTAG
jgi:hypothetical protein